MDYFRPVHFAPRSLHFTGVWKALFMAPVQKVDLSKEWKETAEVRDLVRKRIVSSFVLLDKIDDGGMTIYAASPDTTKINQFLDCMVSTWVDTAARFTRSVWN